MMFGYGSECWDGGWGVGMIIMMIVWILFIVFVIYGVVYWVRNMLPPWNDDTRRKGEWSRPPRKKALEILEEAYARGAISREEFLQKRDDLMEK